MRSSIQPAAGFILLCAALMPARSLAQSEIAADHFEMTNVEPIPQPTNTATANDCPRPMQISTDNAGSEDQGVANSGTAQSRDARLQFELFGMVGVIDAGKSVGISALSQRILTIVRTVRQASAAVHAFCAPGEAMHFSTESADRGAGWPPAPLF
jgi:hypothetical protein